MSGGGKHTIILVQYTNSFQTRSYMDFAGVNAAMDALVKMYEHKLKELNPQVKNITYDVSDLYNYLDSLQDVCALVFDSQSNKYEPHDKSWVKQKIFAHLRGQAK
mmetsp:Transcript_2139/g.3360  ORF Transcript_2139/g.3360 Transcript_2139/m.3360 type:complete len:105 (+) Transcript_2139:87-401(+)|eukprot:CAMPEP_0174956342 /NCGR_PEP_ID=MMETSP0004_2-20121128/1476_1 /TAXON_ID=420556 /ORGANISM="Ochromonas sp., Strain CCMP1393" /LENGTH=104 /DNA_ID=CAMNT_0016204355 /DNA_START=74 /DNA_END=388 /DNA_ORIENTATION=+